MQNSARNTSNALTLNGAQLSTDGTFAGNSDALVPSQKSSKTYSDAITSVIAQHNFIPKSQCVIQGSVDANGQANFLSASTDGVALSATATNILIAYANGQDVYGQKNYIESINADVTKTNTWGTLPAGTSYLYKELDITNPNVPVASYGSSLEQPDYVTADNQSGHALLHFETTADDYGSVWTYGAGATISSTSPKIGTYCLSCTAAANSYVTHPSLRPNGLFTVEGYLKINALSQSGAIFAVNGTITFLIQVDPSNKIAMYVSNNNSSYNIANGTLGTTVMTTGVWYHIAFVYDGVNYKVYVNGTAEITQASASYVSSGGLLQLGMTSGTNNLNGYIDEFRYSPYPRYTGNFTAPTVAFTKDASIYNITLRKFPYITTNKIRCYLGEAVSNGSTVSSVITYALNGLYIGQEFTGVGNTKVSAAHNIGTSRIEPFLEARCILTEAGYAINDRIKVSSSTGLNIPAWNRLNLFSDIDETLQAMDSTAHAPATLTLANWKLMHSAGRNF